jgi:hypothetical protein
MPKRNQKMLDLIRFFIFVLFLQSTQVLAREIIVISNPLGPTHSGTPHIVAMIDKANSLQSRYNFVQEFRVGAFESISLRHILTAPDRYLAMITNTTAEAVDQGFVKLENYVPVFSQGDSCWMVIALTGKDRDLASIRNLKEIVVGTPALGGATHLAALEIGRKYNVPVRMIVFRSNFDALINMAANNGVNFVIERVANYQQYKDKNPNMQMLAAQCPTRYPGLPEIPTLGEYGITSPYIWQQLVASRDMDPTRRQEIKEIITRAELSLGREHIFRISDQIPPIFVGKTTEQHYQDSWNRLRYQRTKWQDVFRNP